MFGGSPKKTIAMYGMEIISLFDASPLKMLPYLFVGSPKQTHLRTQTLFSKTHSCSCSAAGEKMPFLAG